MSAINLKVLKQNNPQVAVTGDQPNIPTNNFVYQDLMLDLEVGTIAGNFIVNQAKNLTDIKVSYDFQAIKNSIENLLNSMPGQWLLNPTLGIGLPQFLFLPIDDFTGKKIADAIMQNLTVYEPRVKIQKLQIIGDPDNNAYSITLVIQMLNVNNSSLTLAGTLTDNRFQFAA